MLQSECENVKVCISPQHQKNGKGDERQRVLDALSDTQIVAFYEKHEFEPKGEKNAKGWLNGGAIGRDDKHPSAGVYLGGGAGRGSYKDHGGSSLSLFDAVMRFESKSDFKEALHYLAGIAGIQISSADRLNSRTRNSSAVGLQGKSARTVPTKPTTPPSPRAGSVSQRFATMVRDLAWFDQRRLGIRQGFADDLGLPVACMDAMPLGVSWHHGGTPRSYADSDNYDDCNPRLALPEYDGDSRIIGIQTRQFSTPNPTGGGRGSLKRCLAGSQRGLSIPVFRTCTDKHVFVAEGATDVLTLDAMGLFGIGTPSKDMGAEHLATWVGHNPGVVPVLLVENDKKPDDSWPSMEGRRRIASELRRLGVSCTLALTPNGAKDAREWYQRHRDDASSFAERALAGVFIDSSQCAQQKRVSPLPPIPVFVARGRLESAVFTSTLPCPKGPKAAFRGIAQATNGRNFIGRLRCLKWGCPSCIALKKQRWADEIMHGMETAGEKTWYAATYAEGDWKKIVPKLSRAGVKYARLKYDGSLLTIGDKPIPNGESLATDKAWQRGVDYLNAMQPDKYIKNYREPIATHKRGVSLSDNWPRVESDEQVKDLVKRKYAFLGTVTKDLPEIQSVLNRWEIGSELWEELPENFQWCIEWSMRANMKPEEIIDLWKQLGLRPRKGESDEAMIARFDDLFWEEAA